MTPQLVELCKFFINHSNRFVSDDTIKDIFSMNKSLTTLNIQRLVSNIRRVFKDKKIKIIIKRNMGKGYFFDVKNIL